MPEIKLPKVMAKTYTAVWSCMPDPIKMTECPHCGATILMSKMRTVDILKRWAKKLKK